MNATIPKIKALHNAIERNLFYIDPKWDYAKTTRAIGLLARLVHEYDSPDNDNSKLWAIGEFGHCSLPDLITGAYWHFSHWHDGQASESYATLSALGEVFSSGMTSAPTRGESEYYAYKALDSMARKANGLPVYSFCSIPQLQKA